MELAELAERQLLVTEALLQQLLRVHKSAQPKDVRDLSMAAAVAVDKTVSLAGWESSYYQRRYFALLGAVKRTQAHEFLDMSQYE